MKADTGTTGAPAYVIHRLNFGSVRIDKAGLVRGREPGTVTTVPAQGYLITGGPGPILVDAGYRDPSVLGSGGVILPEQEFHAQLAAHGGITPADLHCAMATHWHRDHAGHFEDIPMDVPVIVNRAEMGAAFGGLQGFAYARDDLHHLVDRYFDGGLRLLDLDQSGPLQILPGITCYATGGHTAGSMSITVTTAEGIACLCGDLVYDLDAALLHHPDQTPTARMQPGYLDPAAPATTANFTPSLAQEVAALQRLTGSGYRFILPAHCDPGVLNPYTGDLVGRIRGDVIPGPVTPVDAATRPTTHPATPEGA